MLRHLPALKSLPRPGRGTRLPGPAVWAVLIALGLMACSSPPPSATPTEIPPAPPNNSDTSVPGLGLVPNLPDSTAVFPLPTQSQRETPGETPAPTGDGSAAQAPPNFASTVATSFPPPPDRDLFQLARELVLPAGSGDIPRVVNPEPVSYRAGRQDSFWLVNFQDLDVYQSEFELRLVSDRAYWYVEKGLPVTDEDLRSSAAEFEDRIYPRVTAVFGSEWSPGVDNDPRLNIIHAGLQGVAGYFSSADEHPEIVYPYSNQRETIYINSRVLRAGTDDYLDVLAHELQHAVHWNGDPNEDTWVNEGLSELSVAVAGSRSGSLSRFMGSPTVSLIHWPLDQRRISAHYGGAALFMHYLAAHYGPIDNLINLVAEPADGIAGIDNYLSSRGGDVTFRDVFRDWVVANILDEDQGVYGYPDLNVSIRSIKTIDEFSVFESEIPQYSAEYLDLSGFDQPLGLRFNGPTENNLLPTDVGPSGCWWSNSGDSINSTMTRAVDLAGLESATLNYQAWYHLEADWDYGYVEVSSDRGQTWDVLETPSSSPNNPIGNGFGPGYTGDSDGWISETVDLTPYTGSEVLLRFQYVTDDAINGAGLCFRDISVPEAGLEADDWNWQTQGFIRINNRVRQEYIVQVIQIGDENRVSNVPLDSNNSGELLIPDPQALDWLVVVVAALAPRTLQPAPYTLTVEPAQ